MGSATETMFNFFALLSKGIITPITFVLYYYYRVNHGQVVTIRSAMDALNLSYLIVRRHRDALIKLGAIHFDRSNRNAWVVYAHELSITDMIDRFSVYLENRELNPVDEVEAISTFSMIAGLLNNPIPEREQTSGELLEEMPEEDARVFLNIWDPTVHSSEARKKRIEVFLDYSSAADIYSALDHASPSQSTTRSSNNNSHKKTSKNTSSREEASDSLNSTYTTHLRPRLCRENAKKFRGTKSEEKVLRLLDPRFALAIEEWTEFELEVKGCWSIDGTVPKKKAPGKKITVREIKQDEDWDKIFPVMEPLFPKEFVHPNSIRSRKVFDKVCRFYLDHEKDFADYAKWYREVKYPAKGFNWGLFCLESMYDEYCRYGTKNQSYLHTSTNMRKSKTFKLKAAKTKSELARIYGDGSDQAED